MSGNSNKDKYIGITIGPIFETLLLTTTPSGLWGASYLFSYFTKNLIINLMEHCGLKAEDFLVPCWNDTTKKIVRNNKNAGLFHDRIIFKIPNNFDFVCIEEVINKTKKKLGADIEYSINQKSGNEEKEIQDYVCKYIQVNVIEKEVLIDENPILKLSGYLDALELGCQYIENEGKNYIIKFLEDRDNLNEKRKEGKNQNLKKFVDNCIYNESNKKWHFYKEFSNNGIISIDDIAGVISNQTSSTEKNNYFVMVKSDGDNLTSLLKNMTENESIKKFSEFCFKYANEAYESIDKYGGKVIYAGGDDLLFIAPVVNNNKNENKVNNVFALIKSLNEKFQKLLAEYEFHNRNVTFSAGVVMCYYKYPLYEALVKVEEELQRSKNIDGKNTISIYFEKNSGKGHGFQFKKFNDSEEYDVFFNIIEKALTNENDSKSKLLKSIKHKYGIYNTLLIEAMIQSNNIAIKNVIQNIFEEYGNIFDNKDQSEEAKYIQKISKILLSKHQKLLLSKNLRNEYNKILEEIDSMLGIINFYDGGEK